ncbi:Ig-like domain-containing protein [Arthrobacter sp. I2-34]|uniref:Ig-like domain-containing protein n=1 Tax=Arthrobacter hankyongi TaxID=2904801 RepID=A0ABS9LD26_9MICC|nr:Ig-like domain-containing protein [Arthrobacter hankyongi]MCG2624555.1 Ig-like domain-containing protein [Arthrobacter hankyongi]
MLRSARRTKPYDNLPPDRGRRPAARRFTAGLAALVLGAGFLPAALAPAAVAAPVGQGLTLNAGDMRFILKQIKIAENHATKEDADGKPVPGQPLLGSGPNQIANALLPYGLRTVDGSENNLVKDQGHYGAGSLPFPRMADPQWRTTADGKSYGTVNANLTDAEPRFISNVIVDQTAANPAAIAAAGKAHRTVNDGPTAVPCAEGQDPATEHCVPEGGTLDIPNVTTDFGLSPPYNGFFALFGQFFDHGVDFTKKTSNYVMMPLAADDPLVLEGKVPASQRFMILNRAENQPGPDGKLGTEDDVPDGTNTDSPWVDQSQTYSSHPSHQVFLREYELSDDGKPVATGRMAEGTPNGTKGGMSTWKDLKGQAAAKLGLLLSDADVANIPLLATDQYGRFLRGPHGLPQYITQDNQLIEGNLDSPVAPPADVQRTGIAFLDDISHNAVPFDSRTGAPLAKDDDGAITGAAARQPAGTYDDEMLNAHFVAGDGRVNENIGLTAIHQIFHSEHNRLVGYMQDLLTFLNLDLDEWKLASGAWNGERLFQAARFVTEMEYQHIVFEDFARKIQPGINPFNVFTQSDTGINPAIKAEFAHATYRFGHSMLTDRVDRKTNNGTDIGMPLLEAFLNPPAYYANGGSQLSPEAAAGAIAMGMTDQVGAELDEFVTDTLRNNVLGLPLDLAALNLARGRDTGVPSLNNFRTDLYRKTNDSSLKPYESWVDFGQALKHPDSVVNFMAAYGTHPSITNATTIKAKRAAAQLLFDMDVTNPDTPADAYAFVNSAPETQWATDNGSSATGVDAVDLWVGGLAEAQNLFGGLLGSTFNYIFERQLTDLQDGDRLYYLSRTSGLNLRTQLEGNSMAELVMRNTDAAALKADVFGVADCEFELGSITPGTGNNVLDDPASACDESKLLLRMADGTIRYRVSNAVDRPGLNAQATYNGTSGRDRVWGGVDNDTFWGNEGDDVIEGNDGADTVLGGEGDDRITDSAGDDVLKGGPGNDAIDAGPGLDIIMSGDGDDFANGGLNANETFAGEGNDLVMAGDGPDTVFGGGGDDWQEGGNSNDLLQGDSGAPFFDDLNKPGHDVLIGDSGEDDYDAEGGDDIMVAGPGIERNHGVYGFDWVTHARSVEPGDSDMRMLIVDGPNALRDRFLLVEGLSGWDKDDVLRGEDTVPSDPAGDEVGVPGLTNVLDADGIKRIDGLAGLLPKGATEFGAGDIIIGGSGSDQIWGNGADDIIDGDKWLNVRLSVRTDPADPATETRSANSLKELQADLQAGRINPGNVVIVREILDTAAETDVDTANYSGARNEYDITTTDGVTTVTHVGATGNVDDGTDRLTNIERLQFADGAFDINGAEIGTPTVTAQDPQDGATEVPVTANVTATFSEPVTGLDENSFRMFRAFDGEFVPATVSWDEATRTVTLNPDQDLDQDTVYIVELGDTIQDADGLALAQASWSFTTEGPAPTVAVRTPANDATEVAANSTVSATFSEAVTGVDGSTMTLTPGTGAGTPVAATVNYDEATHTATLDPNADLAADTVYTVRLTEGIKDGSGKPLAATSWTFTTTGPAPAVAGRTPASNATNVATNANVTATFSEAVPGISAGTMTLTASNGAAVPAAFSYDPISWTATLDPNANLAVNTRYTVKLADGITDRQGKALAATSWSFTTEAGPAITGRTPAVNATNVAANGNITVTFSKPVTGAGTGTVTLRGPNNAAVAAAVGYNAANRTVTLNPNANLAAGTRYTVALAAGIRDASGNPLAAASWSFTTEAGPAITGRTPAVNATNVATGGNITVTFSKPVTGINGTSLRVTNPAGTTVAAAVSWNAATRTATLNPNASLAAGTRYTVRLSNAIKDGTGNPLAATSWSFTTAPGPSLSSRTPAPGATGVSRATNVTVRFSEPVTGVGRSSFRLFNSRGQEATGTVSYNAATRTATLNPSGTRQANTRYTVRLSNTIRDADGNRLAATSWTFTTGR